ncbi:hypothetical protein BX265_3507 [Streptomyces sp. TLI_235]|nr:hypothetical protein BX265_3507 [Streptomyces sp. TLI_235]
MSTPVSTAIAPSRRSLLRPDECRAWTGASCFCAGILGVEAVDDLGELRDTFDAARPDYRDVIRAACCTW